MEAIVVHPENADQLKTLRAFLKALKIPFESQSTSSLPSHVSESIDKGIKQFEAGQTISLDEFIDKHITKK